MTFIPGQPDPTGLEGDGFDPNSPPPDDTGLPPDTGDGNAPLGDPNAAPRGYEYNWRNNRATFQDDELRPFVERGGFSSPEDLITHLQKAREIAHWSQHYETASNQLIEREQALAAQAEEMERQARVLEAARAAIYGGGAPGAGMPPGPGYPGPGSSPGMGYPSPYGMPGRQGGAAYPGQGFAPQGFPPQGMPGRGGAPSPMDPYQFTGQVGQQIQSLHGQVQQLMAVLASEREERQLREDQAQVEASADAFLTAKKTEDKELYGNITRAQLLQRARQLGYTRNRNMPWNEVFEETLSSLTRSVAPRLLKERWLREMRSGGRTAPANGAGAPGARPPNLRPPLGGGPARPQGLLAEIEGMEAAMTRQEIPLGRQSSE